MDLDEDILMIQGILNNADKTYGPLSSLIIRGGNESKILSIAKKLYNHLSSKKYIQKDKVNLKFAHVLRKINLFFLLNTDLIGQNALQEEPNIGHLAAIAPQISKCLLMEFVWSLNLGPYFCEVITHCPISITYDLLESIVSSVKYSGPYPQLERISMLVHALYLKIYLLKNEKIYKMTVDDVLSGLFRAIIELLEYYITPNADHMSNWLPEELYRYTGYAMMHVLQLAYDNLYLYYKKCTIEKDRSLKVYDFECDFGGERYCAPESKEIKIDTILKKCNNCLISSCKANVTAINVNIFCSWSEFQLDNTAKTLQEAVGNSAYLLSGLLKETGDCSDSEMIGMLSSISVKPKTIDDDIKSADIDMVIKNVKIKNEVQKKWFDKLISYDQLFTKEKLLVCLKQYINDNVCDVDMVIKILNRCCVECSKKLEDKSSILEIVQLATRNLNSNDFSIVATTHFQNNGLDNHFESPNFSESLTEVLNKVVIKEKEEQSNEVKHRALQSLILESPVSVIDILFETGLKGTENCTLIVDILKEFKWLCDLTLSSDKTVGVEAFKKTFNRDVKTDNDRNDLLLFLNSILQSGVVDVHTIAEDVVLLNIHKYLNDCSLEKVYLCFELSKNFYNREFFKPKLQPFLCYLSEVLENIRWDIASFSSNAVSVVETILCRIDDVIKELKNTKENEVKLSTGDIEFIKGQLKSISAINRYRFLVLWEDQVIDLFSYVWPGKLSENSRTWNVTRMCELLPCCITDEWKNIVQEMLSQQSDTLEIFNMLLDFLFLQVTLTEQSQTDSTLGCLDYCIRNFSLVLKEKEGILNRISSCYNAELVVWKGLLQLAGKLPKAIQKSSSMYLFNILSPLLNSLQVKNEDVKSNITLDLIPVSNIELAEMLSKKMCSKN